jgi:polysaccharide export outer membrane protein
MRSWFVVVPWVVVTVIASSCSPSQPYVWASTLSPAELNAPAALRPGDKLQLAVYGQDALSGEFEIRADGTLVLPVIGSVAASGRTPQQIGVEVTQRLQGTVTSPRVTVALVSRRPTGVSVLGEVRSPGRYELTDGENVLHALARAGGLTEFADPDSVFVVRAEGSRRIRFRYVELTAPQAASARFQLRNGDVVVVE